MLLVDLTLQSNGVWRSFEIPKNNDFIKDIAIRNIERIVI